jgi:hypothetical protein
LAYWTAPGGGSGQATTGTLNVPTNLVASATIGSRTVNLTWNASTLSSGTTAQGYYLTRTKNSDSSTTAACGTSATNLTAANSCTDLAVPDETFHYTVTAVYQSWTATGLSSNNVTVRTASKLAFTTAPSSSAISAVALANQPVVTVQDAAGVTITTDMSSVTLTLTTPGGATLACTANSKAAVSGVADFTGAGCKIDKVGTYTLTATDGSLAPAISTNVTITAGAATRLAITSTAVSGLASATANLGPITVQRQDAFGNLATPATPLTVTLASDSAGTKVFAVTQNGTPVSSVTIPSGQSSTNFYYGDTRAATPMITASGLGSTSQVETITAAAGAKLAIISTAVSGPASSNTNLGPMTVQRQDAFGNPVAPATSQTVNLATSTPGNNESFDIALGAIGSPTLAVTIPVGASSTSFYYGDETAGSPTITASGTLTSATQIETITAATANKLAFGQQPSNEVAGVSISPSPTVQIQDQFGNLTPSTASVTMAIANNPSSGTLSGTKTLNAVNGVATLSTLSIDKAGNSYTLTATSAGLTSMTSNGFNITAAAASKLAFSQQPSNTRPSVSISPSPTVQVLDQFGNLTSSAATVTMAIANNPSSGTLSGTRTVNAVNGVATFTTLLISNAGNGYTLTATSGSLTSAVSSSFNIDNTHPTAVNFTTTNGGSNFNRLEQGDTFTLTYSENMLPASIIAGWNGATTLDVVVRVTNNSGNDTLTVYNDTNSTLLKLGTVELQRSYVGQSSTTFGASGTHSTLTMSGSSFTIALGTWDGSGTMNTVSNGNVRWDPDTSATDLAGNTASTNPFNETDNDRDF